MKTYDNSGRLISEINTIYTKQGVVTTSTVYYNDRVISRCEIGQHEWERRYSGGQGLGRGD